MSRPRSIGLLIATALVVIAAVLVLRSRRSGGDDDRERGASPTTGVGVAADRAGPRPSAGRGDGGLGDGAPAAEELPPISRDQRLALHRRLFEEYFCPTVSAARCDALRPLVDACRSNDAAACVRAAELLLQPPRMPDRAMLYLRIGCEANDATACARQQQLRDWMQAAVDHSFAVADGEPVTANAAAAACADGAADACWFQSYYGTAEGQPFDLEVGWRACNGGVARTCLHVARAAPDPATAVRALEIGCGHGDVTVCRALHSVLVGDGICCVVPIPVDPLDRNNGIPCPAPDPTRAATVAARIVELTGKPFVPRPVPPDDDDGAPEL